MPVRTKDLPEWQEKKAERAAHEAKKPKKLKKKFKDLSAKEKDDLILAIAIKLDLIDE